jgi:SAM-dependent methyltransferase
LSRRVVFRCIQYVLFLPLLMAFSLMWIVQIIVVLPLAAAGALVYRGRRLQELRRPVGAEVSFSGPAHTQRTLYDRVNDVSKIYGCNVRNVSYRWKLFADAIAELQRRRGDGKPLAALDFGAGSLRDTYELSALGFGVTAVDFNEEALRDYYRAYDWSRVKSPPVVSSRPLNELAEGNFDVAVAFDVIEHLDRVEPALSQLRRLLLSDGIVLVTVPNRYSLYEIYWKFALERGFSKDAPPGVNHLQFHNPEEWRAIFENNGFEVLRQDVSVGFLVNNAFHGLYRIPLGLLVDPVLRRFRERFSLGAVPAEFSLAFCPGWLMELVHYADLLLRPFLQRRWGWNLFVLSPLTRQGTVHLQSLKSQ